MLPRAASAFARLDRGSSWLMVEVQESPDDRIPERPVFPGGIREALRNGMASTCKAAEIANYSPHDLRHKLQLG
jgi:hypothetical protein